MLKLQDLITFVLNISLKHALLIVDQIQIIDNGDLILGEKTQLFKCSSSQRITLNGTFSGTTYTMYMDMSNTQIQAFDIVDGNLSSNG